MSTPALIWQPREPFDHVLCSVSSIGLVIGRVFHMALLSLRGYVFGHLENRQKWVADWTCGTCQELALNEKGFPRHEGGRRHRDLV